MRARPSAKLLVLDTNERVLLFRFVHRSGALAGQDFWAPPGGGVEDGERFEQAAIRELREETGLCVDDVGVEVARREVIFQLPDGEYVSSDERYFVIKTDAGFDVSRDGWTALEASIMTEWRWWSKGELAQTTATVWPEGLLAMLEAVASQ